MLTVRDSLTARLQRLRGRKAHLQAELAEVNAKIDDVQALRDALTVGEETLLATLADLGVIKAED